MWPSAYFSFSKGPPMNKLLLYVSLSFATHTFAQSTSIRDDFSSASCLHNTFASQWLSSSGELKLSLNGGGAQFLQTTKTLSYGKYEARIKTDLGAGAVLAFYLMGVDGQLRNNPRYFSQHDEIDIELVGSLWRDGQYIGPNATWINAYAQHESLILPRYRGDDAGGSLLALSQLSASSPAVMQRHTLPAIAGDHNLIGHNFNDGKYYTYVIDYSSEAMTFTVKSDEGSVVRQLTLTKNSERWPKPPMYLALSLWTANDVNLARNFLGYYDYNFGRPMTATIDFVSYTPSVAAPANETLKWSICPASNTSNSCYTVNRDGVTCSAVGMREGETSLPWGARAGRFTCIEGCLKYVGP